MIKVKATNVHYLEDLKVSNKHTILNVKGAKLINKNPNTYRGNELFFLGSFCKGDKKKRNLCNRLIIDLGDKKAFSYEDIDYILDGLKALSYSKTKFFKHLKFIKNFNIKK